MSDCKVIRKKKRRVCIGDMRDAITLQQRTIDEPLFNTVDFDENFDPVDPLGPDSLALIETVSGLTYFDGVNQRDRNVTHIIFIPYREDVGAQTWILFEGRRIDILHSEDLDERHEVLKFTCQETGKDTHEASKI